MCGIVGMVLPGVRDDAKELIKPMVAQIAHRGPDGIGVKNFSTSHESIVFGHARLAIIDLSNAGLQPMVSVCGRYTIIFNGEIYNYREIRNELRSIGETFTTDTDTEVLLAAIKVWGTSCFERINGMWAFACYDKLNNKILLARDRLGIKPLYYEFRDGIFAFASEIKALLCHGSCQYHTNTEVAFRYLNQSLLDIDNQTFFMEIKQFPAGHYAWVTPGHLSTQLGFVRYWWPERIIPSISGGVEAKIEELRQLFEDSVRLRLRSDVPIGVLLSGGVDSSSIAASMCNIAQQKNISVFSAVSDDKRFDESNFIDIVSSHLKLQVNKVKLDFDPKLLWNLFCTTTWYNDEPLLSFSSIAHMQLMEAAKISGVKVILSGQGADELFCGYRKYVPFFAQSLINKGHYFAAFKMLMKFLARKTFFNQFNYLEGKRYLPSKFQSNKWSAIDNSILQANKSVSLRIGSQSLSERQLRDLLEYSVPVLLHYEDRMSMVNAREIRLPFLDYRIVEFAMALPDEFKINDGWTKWILRKAFAPYLPPEIIWRRDKKGFINPQSEWLRTTLRADIENVFRDGLLSAENGLVNADRLRRTYREYVEGNTSISFQDVFNPLALEIWMRQFSTWLK